MNTEEITYMNLFKIIKFLFNLPQFWIFTIVFIIILTIGNIQGISLLWSIPAGWSIAGTIRAGYDAIVKIRSERE